MPDVLYRNMNIVMFIETSGDFHLFYDFPYGQILTLFMRYLGNIYIANSHTRHKTNKIIKKYTQILLFNNNADAKEYSFIFNEDIGAAG